MIDSPMIDSPMIDSPMIDSPMIDSPMIDSFPEQRLPVLSVLLSQAGQGPLLPDMLHSQMDWIDRNHVRLLLSSSSSSSLLFLLLLLFLFYCYLLCIPLVTTTQVPGSHHSPPPLHELYRLLSGDVRGFVVQQHMLLLQASPSAKMLLLNDAMFDWKPILGLFLWCTAHLVITQLFFDLLSLL
jgi:hypothetical protein